MFFKTNQELQSILPVSTGFTLKNFQKYLKLSDLGFIQNTLIGKSEYDVLLAEYDLNTYAEPSREQAAGVLQIATAYYAYANAIPSLGVEASDAGMMVKELPNSRIAYQWKELKNQTQAFQIAYEYAEYLLKLMEENADDFPDFKASVYFTIQKTSLVKSVDTFCDYININHSRLLFKRLQRPLKKFQDKTLPAILGLTLANEIIEQLTEDSLSTENAALLSYLCEYITHSVFADSMGVLPIEFDNNGMYLNTPKNQTNNTNDKAIPDNHLTALKRTHQEKANAAHKELIDYLHTQVANYPSFINESKFYRKPSSNKSSNSAEAKVFWF